jgi:uncharacterized protein (DUF1330 family)
VSSGILLVVNLYVESGREDEFRRFETHAARIMRSHGGQIEKVIRPTLSLSGEPLPHEIHLLSFPSMEHLAAYRSDPILASFAGLRELAIKTTTITIGEEIEPYS